MSRPLRIGVQLPEVEREVAWAEYVAVARAAEEAGALAKVPGPPGGARG